MLKQLSQYSNTIVFQLNNKLIITNVWPEVNCFSKTFTTGLYNKKFTSLINKKQLPLFNSFIQSKLLSQKTNEFLLKISSNQYEWFSVKYINQNHNTIISVNNIHHLKQNIQQDEEAVKIKLYKEFLDNIPVPFGISSLDYNLIFLNKKFTETYGYTINEIKDYNKWFSKFKFEGVDGEAKHDEEFYALLAKSRKSPNTTLPFLHRQWYAKSGELKDVRIAFKILGNQMFGVIEDITEQLKAEAKLKESERLFKALANNIALPVVCYDSDTMDMVFVNKPFTKTIGYNIDEIRPLKKWCKIFYYPNKEEQQKQTLIWLQAVDDKRNRKTREAILLEKIINCKDGSQKLFEVSITVGNNLVYGVFKDITQQKQAQNLLKESEQRFRILAENMPIAIGSHDLEGNIIFFNKHFTKQTGYNLKDIRTLNDWYNLTQPDPSIKNRFYTHWIDTIKKYKDGKLKKQPHIESSALCKNKKFKTFNYIFNIVQNTVYVILVDITKQKEATKQLSQSHQQLRVLTNHLQKAREEERKFIAQEIHDEFGQLITGLKFDINIIKRKIEKVMPEMADTLNETMQLTDRIVKTVRRISTELRPSIIDDIGLTAAIEWECKEFTKRTKIICTFSNQCNEPSLDTEKKSSLFRIFQESLTNIIRHANATNVKVLIKKKKQKVILQIEDNGKGFTINSQIKTLGIIGMRERALAIGGNYLIKSEPGKGTQTYVEIPV
ncbi:MAG: PAS domain S-box protein [Bacteroidetes bacterium]|nr:PAS domain S-box protein [Bacteroidota bacterium]MBS1648716.1 PAS domain S-box protein [Bacteroidota bacterium]